MPRPSSGPGQPARPAAAARRARTATVRRRRRRPSGRCVATIAEQPEQPERPQRAAAAAPRPGGGVRSRRRAGARRGRRAARAAGPGRIGIGSLLRLAAGRRAVRNVESLCSRENAFPGAPVGVRVCGTSSAWARARAAFAHATSPPQIDTAPGPRAATRPDPLRRRRRGSCGRCPRARGAAEGARRSRPRSP